jgi:anti-sigma factor RsiW
VSAPDDRLDHEDAATWRLLAYADGRLSPEEARAVEQQLTRDPDAAARVADWRAINDRLHALYDPTLDEPVPARLTTLPRRPWRAALQAAVLAVVWLGAGAAIGWWWRGPGAPAPAPVAPLAAVAERAALAHSVYVPEVRHAVEVTADQETHLVAWLSKRLTEPVKAPKLQASGYELVGGRLLPSAPDGPAAQLMYQEAGGSRITLYLKCVGPNAKRETAFRYDRSGSIGVFTWIDDRVAYALTADLPREKHLVLAETIYKQLNP